MNHVDVFLFFRFDKTLQVKIVTDEKYRKKMRNDSIKNPIYSYKPMHYRKAKGYIYIYIYIYSQRRNYSYTRQLWIFLFIFQNLMPIWCKVFF